MYLGQWSPNCWHSPTMTLLKPFTLLAFFLVLIFIEKKDYTNNFQLFILSLFLLIGAFIKPSFIICFLPALAVFLLIFRYKQYKLYFRLFLVFLPCLFLLLYQYFSTYYLSNTDSYFHDKIILTFFGVTKLYTKSILFSTIRVLAFPLMVLIFSFKQIIKKTPLLLSWIMLIIAFIISGFIAEQEKFDQGAFIWSYENSLYILFVFSVCECLNWVDEFKKNKNKIIIVGSIFLFHVISGVLYLIKILYHGGFK